MSGRTMCEPWARGFLILDVDGDVVAVVTFIREATAPRGAYWAVTQAGRRDSFDAGQGLIHGGVKRVLETF